MTGAVANALGLARSSRIPRRGPELIVTFLVLDVARSAWVGKLSCDKGSGCDDLATAGDCVGWITAVDRCTAIGRGNWVFPIKL